MALILEAHKNQGAQGVCKLNSRPIILIVSDVACWVLNRFQRISFKIRILRNETLHFSVMSMSTLGLWHQEFTTNRISLICPRRSGSKIPLNMEFQYSSVANFGKWGFVRYLLIALGFKSWTPFKPGKIITDNHCFLERISPHFLLSNLTLSVGILLGTHG